MASLPAPVRIPRGPGGYCDAEIVACDEELRTFVAEKWVEGLKGSGEDDALWDWPNKHQDPTYTDALEHVALVADGEVQGVMLTSVPASVKPGLSKLENLLYVEYVATAPWNRRENKILIERFGPPRFKAVGPFLLRHAVGRSSDVGRSGRVGLHAEPNAEKFYIDIKLDHRGKDTDPAMPYFEGDEAWAEGFLARGK